MELCCVCVCVDVGGGGGVRGGCVCVWGVHHFTKYGTAEHMERPAGQDTDSEEKVWSCAVSLCVCMSGVWVCVFVCVCVCGVGGWGWGLHAPLHKVRHR